VSHELRAQRCARRIAAIAALAAFAFAVRPATAQEPAATPAIADGAQAATLEALRDFARDPARGGGRIESLFAVRLDDAKAVRERVAELARMRATLDERMRALASRERDLAAAHSGASDRRAALEAELERLDARAAELAREAEAPEPALDDATVKRDADIAARRAEIESELAQLAARRAEIEAALASLDDGASARAGESSEVAAQRAAIALEIELASERARWLGNLDARLAAMSDAGRRVLAQVADPRAGLRARAEQVAALAAALDGLATRVDGLAKRASAGALVGFVSEERALSADIASVALAYRERAARSAAAADALGQLASELEAEGAALRETFLRRALAGGAKAAESSADGSPSADAFAATDFDALFLEHRARQRRLRKSAGLAPQAQSLEALRSLAERASSALPRPRSIATVADARAFLDANVAFEQAIDAELAAEAASADAWRLAHENEVVALLADQVSDEARAEAYGFSRELVDDVRGEVAIAIDRARTGLAQLRRELPDATALVASARGQGVLARLAGVLAIAALALFARRRAPEASVAVVKSLARLPALRSRVGLVVRLVGLVQQVSPALIAIAALAAVIAVLGRDAWISGLLGTIGWPLLAYAAGKQVVLGVTQRVTRGRPALIELPASDRERLVRTYASLGQFAATAFLLDGLGRMLVGAGRLVALIDSALVVWVGGWAVFEMFRWRAPLAARWRALAESGSIEARIAEAMQRSPLGFALAPLALARVVLTPIVRFVALVATNTDFAQMLRARWIRRRSRHAQAEGSAAKPSAIAPEYLAAFPLHPILGEEEQVLVPREELVAGVLAQIERWKQGRVDGSLAIVGEKGLGKTTLAAVVARRAEASGMEVVALTLRGKPTTERDLLRALAPAFGFAQLPDSVERLCEQLEDGPERVVLLDEAHNVFLRMVDGYEAYDALVELVNRTCERVFWVLVFNSFTWRFLNESRGRVHYFRKILEVPRFSVDEVQELVRLRNEKAGFALEFDELLLSEEDASRDRAIGAGGPRFELVESSDGYFRLLWESSGGNPRIATQLWLASLTPVGERRLRVGLFREPTSKAFDDLNDELWFALAAVCQHENLAADELARVINSTPGFARFAVQFLAEAGFATAKDENWERVTLSAEYYRAVLRGLRSKHLLYD